MKIGIANDVPMATEAMRRTVTSTGQHQVVWTASNGLEALGMCVLERPDLILMDLLMPVLGGIEATRMIMAHYPCAILIVTANVSSNASQVFEAMGQGALDAIDTPVMGLGTDDRGARRLLAKIDALESVLVGRPAPTESGPVAAVRSSVSFPLIAVGASAGGPAALATLLAALPADSGAAIVIIQHVDAKFASGMADWLAQQSRLPVTLAREGQTLQPGDVLMAGSDDHLVFKAGQRIGYTAEPADYVYRPSVDVFFRSLCQHWAGAATGVLLTGMGRDGAIGLREMRERGFHTIAQDQKSSAVYGMPKAAAKLDSAVEILPLPQIAPRLIQLVRRSTEERRA